MGVILIVSKEADVLARLHDLFRLSPEDGVQPHLIYFGGASRALYYGWLIERYGLWDEAFDYVVGRGGGRARYYVEGLSDVELFGWDDVENELRRFGNNFIEAYKGYENDIRRWLGRVLGVRTFFDNEYVILAFNPGRGVFGSIPRVSKVGRYAVITLYVGVGAGAKEAVDLFVHELIHGLIRLNNLPVPEEYEEELVDALCPEGWLSMVLGLSEGVRVEESGIKARVGEYFSNRHYERVDLITYLMGRARGGYVM